MKKPTQMLLATALLAACGSAQPYPGGSHPPGDGDRVEGMAIVSAAGERMLSAAFLIVDGVYNTELTAPYDVLQHTRYHAGDGLGIRTFTVSPNGQPVTTAEGLRIGAEYSFETAPAADILVVPSAEHSRDTDLENEELIRWVRNAAEQARVVMSLCWGAFVLAEAGVLDGHACTTFPSDYDTFAQRFPQLELHVNVSFVRDGKVLTSQGGSRSFDAAMHLVEVIYGEETARNVGAGLLIPWPPRQQPPPSYLIDR